MTSATANDYPGSAQGEKSQARGILNVFGLLVPACVPHRQQLLEIHDTLSVIGNHNPGERIGIGVVLRDGQIHGQASSLCSPGVLEYLIQNTRQPVVEHMRHQLDMEKLLDLLDKRGLISGKNFFADDGSGRGWNLKYFEMRKKKLNRAIKQLLNKCLCNHAKAQKEEYDFYSEMAEKDLDDEMEERHAALDAEAAEKGSEYDGTECNSVRVRPPKPYLHPHDEDRFSASDFDLDIDIPANVSPENLHPLDGPLPDDRDEPLTIGVTLRQYVDDNPEKFS